MSRKFGSEAVLLELDCVADEHERSGVYCAQLVRNEGEVAWPGPTLLGAHKSLIALKAVAFYIKLPNYFLETESTTIKFVFS